MPRTLWPQAARISGIRADEALLRPAGRGPLNLGADDQKELAMADPVRFSIGYDQPYSTWSLRIAFEALREAVAENWAAHRDVLSFPEPTTAVEVEEWLKACSPERLHLVVGYSKARASEALDFSYSPRSQFAAHLTVFLSEGGRLDISLWVAHGITVERNCDREEWRKVMEPEFEPPWADMLLGDDYEYWNQYLVHHPEPWIHNRACLLHIVERLRSLFPMQRLHVDQLISEGTEP
jgi:hypothetical protein